MKKILVLIAILGASQAHALYLENGEQTTINGTQVVCGNAAKACSLEHEAICSGIDVRIYQKNTPLSWCLNPEIAAAEFQKFKTSGVCN